MMKKCKGCGTFLQSDSIDLEGYTKTQENDLCERCFKITNYNEYQVINKNNDEFIKILEDINKTNDLVVLIIDLFNIPKNINQITDYINNDILLVFTKKDILPIYQGKLLDYSDKLNINYIDKLVVSSNKNYNFDSLNKKIRKYKKSNNVYIVGFTNSGKSTLINKFTKNYSENITNITTSNLPSTTLNTISIKIDDELTLIDTPGILDEGNIINYIDSKTLKQIIPKNTIKPIIYQIKQQQYILIDYLVKIETSNNNLTLYFSNNLKINRFFKDKELDLKENIIEVKRNQDIVITGLGFIKASKDEIIKVWTKENVDVYTRDSIF